MLAALASALQLLRALDGAIDHLKHLGAIGAEAIESAGANQAFHDALIEQASIDRFGEFEESGKTAECFARLENADDGVFADVFNGAEAEANRVADGGASQ